MDDLISRQAAIDTALRAINDLQAKDPLRDEYIISEMEELPSAERTGRWIFNIDDQGWSWDYPYMCDQCGEWAEKEFKFCPNCGAKMEV